MPTQTPPPGWQLSNATTGTTLIYRPRQATGFPLAIVFVGVIAFFCVYQTYSFCVNWFIDRAEILPAGVVLFLIILGLLLLCVKGITHLMRTICYFFDNQQLVVSHLSWWPKSSTRIVFNRKDLKRILVLYTPPAEAGQQGTWKTALEIAKTLDATGQTFFFEGHSEMESDYLCDFLKNWTSIPVEKPNTQMTPLHH